MTTVKDTTTTKLTLTTTKEEVLASIIEGLYQSKPLIGPGSISPILSSRPRNLL